MVLESAVSWGRGGSGQKGSVSSGERVTQRGSIRGMNSVSVGCGEEQEWPRSGFPLRVPGAWVPVLSVGLGNLGGGAVRGRTTCGAVGTSECRAQPAAGHLGRWCFGAQKRGWGWRPRFTLPV